VRRTPRAVQIRKSFQGGGKEGAGLERVAFKERVSSSLQENFELWALQYVGSLMPGRAGYICNAIIVIITDERLERRMPQINLALHTGSKDFQFMASSARSKAHRLVAVGPIS
jgi:hypothetical protein